MLRNLLLTLLVAFTLIFPNVATAQDTVVTKTYIKSLEERVQKLETNTSANELSKERLDLLNDKIENLQTESQISSAGVANEIAASSNFLTVWSVVFAVAGIALAAFVNTQQNKSGKNLEENKNILTVTQAMLEESKGILELQKQGKNEVLEIQRMINNNLSELYIKLQAEEVNYLIDKIFERPSAMYQLFDRFLVLRLNEEHFRRLSLFVFEQSKVNSEYQARVSVFIIILNRFPQRWLRDRELKQYFVEMNNWIRIIGSYRHKEIKYLIDNLCEYLVEVIPERLDFKVGCAFLEQSHRYTKELRGEYTPPEVEEQVRNSNPDRWFTAYFYQKLDNKELRFNMYSVLITYSTGQMFWELLWADYATDDSNTPEQNELLNRCKDVYLGLSIDK